MFRVESFRPRRHRASTTALNLKPPPLGQAHWLSLSIPTSNPALDWIHSPHLKKNYFLPLLVLYFLRFICTITPLQVFTYIQFQVSQYTSICSGNIEVVPGIKRFVRGGAEPVDRLPQQRPSVAKGTA